MAATVSTASMAAACLLVVAAPWLQAGGRETAGLALDAGAHLLVLGLLTAAALVGRVPAGRSLLPWLPAALLWIVSAAAAGYGYAAGLASFEAGVALALALTLPLLLTGRGGTRRRQTLAAWLPLAALPAALAAVVQAMAGQRGAAGFVNPNHLAAYLLALLPLAVVSGAPIRRLLVTTTIVVGLLSTGSRGALAATALMGLVAALVAARRGMLGARAGRLALAAALLFAVAGVAVLALRFSDGSDVYRYDRLRIWPRAVAAAADTPLLGMGPGQFSHRAAAWNFPRHDEAVRYGRVFHSPHSHLLLLLIEIGVAGTAALLAAGLAVARRCWRGLSGPGGPAAAAAATGLVGLALVSMVDEPLSEAPMLLTAAVLLGLALPGIRLRTAPALSMRALLCAGLAVTAIGWVVQPTRAHLAAVAAADTQDPAARAGLLELARRLAPGQALYPLEEGDLLLGYARRPLDLMSYARIRVLADRAAELDPGRAGAWLLQARLERRACIELLRSAPTCRRAAAAYRRAAETAVTDARLLREEASFAHLMGRPGEAAERLRQALTLEPAYVAAWLDLLRLQPELPAAEQRPEEVAAGLQRARRVAEDATPDSPYARDILRLQIEAGAAVARGGGA